MQRWFWTRFMKIATSRGFSQGSVGRICDLNNPVAAIVYLHGPSDRTGEDSRLGQAKTQKLGTCRPRGT